MPGSTDGLGNVAIVVSYGSSTGQNHALADYVRKDGPTSRDTWRTACGRDASAWSRRDDENIARFMDNPYSCQRCLKAII